MNKELYRPLIFELSEEGRQGFLLPEYDYGKSTFKLPAKLRREEGPALPRSTSPQSCAIIPTAAVTISAWIRASIPWGLAR